jgi:hypothetical protein
MRHLTSPSLMSLRFSEPFLRVERRLLRGPGAGPGVRWRMGAAVSALLLMFALPAGAQPSIFTETVGFATKTGFRAIFTWSATQPVAGVVHYGESPANLDQTAMALPGAPDTAQMAAASNLVRGRTYYWQVEDTLTGERSEIKSLRAANAYNDWNGETYTLNLLVQLDLQDLPPDIPHDQALSDIANGINIFAERVYDALDGYARLGKVIVTDTNLDYAANEPFGDPFGGVACDGENGTLADVLVQTSIPLDSHTWSGWSIDKPCIAFYVGRIGQLVVPWEDELHFGAVNVHEFMHYGFNTPDLYPLANSTTDCRNLDWDGSIMHNTGGYAGKWELTELDRNPTLTPCVHGNAPWSWDVLRTRYTNIPLNPEGPILDMFNEKAKGDPDGEAFEIWVLNREPGASSLTRYVPDDTVPECSHALPPVRDKAGDGSTIHTVDPGLVSDPNLDITEAFFRWNDAAKTLTFTIQVSDLGDVPAGAVAHSYRWFFNYAGKRYQARATRDVTGAQNRRLMDEGATVTLVNNLPGAFDAGGNRITIVFGENTIPNAPPLRQGERLDGFEIFARRDYATSLTGGVSLITDIAKGWCSYIVNQENFGPNAPPQAQDDEAATTEDVPVDVDVLANDSDPDGDPVAVRAAGTKDGSVAVNPDGTARFTPRANTSGTMSFTYVAHDGKGGTASATVTVTVAGLPDPPAAAADTAYAPSATPVVIDVLANDRDPDGDPLAITAITQGTFGRVTTDGATVTYSPGGGFATQDSFTYTVSDGAGGSDRGTVTVVRTCLDAFDDDLEPAPEPGWAFSNSNGGPENLGVSLTTWMHALDPLASSPTHSWYSDASDVSANKDDRLIAPPVLVSAATVLSFWHRYRTEETFDGGLLEVSSDGGATWREITDAGGVFVKGGYDGPASAHGGRSAWNGSSSGFPLMNEVVVDLGALADRTIRVRWRLKTDTNLGDLGWWVDDVRFRDIASTLCGPAQNRLPDAVDDQATAQAGSPTGIDVLANDGDPDGDAVFVTAATAPAHGTATHDGSSVTYTPETGFGGTDHFYYSISDGFGGSDTALVTVTVNAPPQANDDTVTTNEDQALTIAVLENDSDPDGDALAVVAAGVAGHGSAAVNGDGSISYMPDPDFNGSDGFTYVVRDGRGGEATARVMVTVAPVNDAPVAAGDSATCAKNGTVAIPVLANDHDVDGDALRVSTVGRPAYGSVTINPDGSVRYRAKKGFTGSDSFVYAVSDGNGGESAALVSVTVISK